MAPRNQSREEHYAPSVTQAKEAFAKYKPKTFPGHPGKAISTIGWSCDGTRLASGSTDRTAKIWNVARSGDLRCLSICKGHSDSVTQLCWDQADPNRFATASTDKTVRIWDARTAGCIKTVKTMGENINVTWSPDGKHIAVADKDDNVTYIETKEFTPLKTFQARDELGEINEVCWSLSGELFFLTTGSGRVKLMDFQAGKQLSTLYSHTACCYCIDMDPKGRYLATGGADALISLWDLDSFVCVRTFDNSDYAVRTISFSHCGTFIASGTENGLDVAHVQSRECVHRAAEGYEMNAVAWSPTDSILAYSGEDIASRRQEGQIQVLAFPSEE